MIPASPDSADIPASPADPDGTDNPDSAHSHAPAAKPLNVAIIGIGAFGRNHVRVYAALAQTGQISIAALVDSAPDPATDSANPQPRQLAAQHGAQFYPSVGQLLLAMQSGHLAVDCASVCVPTQQHSAVASALIRAGIHVLVEKPLAPTLADADALIEIAARHNRILQVGHLERFNPAVTAVLPLLTRPMFFECHRLNIFTPRSLDVDVVLDLMIHDLDIVLRMSGSRVREIRAVGLPVLSRHADIANVRLEFESGCIANFTASRVSTERVRKLRLFQPREYLSIDYARQDAFRIQVSESAVTAGDPASGLAFEKIDVTAGEPLRLEIEAFLAAVRSGSPSSVPASESRDALALALAVNQAIAEHGKRAGLL